MFDRYTLEKTGDGYSVTLYLNRGQEEFASEPGRRDGGKRQRLEGSVREFVKDKFPNLKVKTAKVMLGTVLVASVPLGGVAAATGTDAGTTPTTDTVDTTTTTTPTGETTTTPTGDTTTTPTGDTTTTPAGDTTTTPTGDTTTTPTGDTTTTPTGDTTTTPTGDTTTTPTGDTTTTPTGDTTTTPTGDTTTTPTGDTTTPPVTPPATGETTTPPAATVTLKDIEASYAKEQINALVAAGVLTGYPDGTFRPTANMTRQEFAVVLAKSLNLDIDPNAKTNFTDVAPWAAPYVAALHDAGIVAGFSDTVYGANAPVTREQLATFYVRALGFEEEAEALNLTPDFTDAARISDWAAPSVAFAKRIGLIEGIPNDNGTVSFAPNTNAQRQQVAVVANKFYSEPEKYRAAGEALAPAEDTGTTTPTPPVTPAPETTTPETPATPAPDTTTTTPDTTGTPATTPDTTGTPATTTPDATPADPDTTTTTIPATTPDTDPDGTASPAPDTTTAPSPDVITTPTTPETTSPDVAPNNVDIT